MMLQFLRPLACASRRGLWPGYSRLRARNRVGAGDRGLWHPCAAWDATGRNEAGGLVADICVVMRRGAGAALRITAGGVFSAAGAR